jgi:hypothetical protein
LKASAQSLNDATFEGVSDVGSGRAINPTVTRGSDKKEDGSPPGSLRLLPAAVGRHCVGRGVG